MTTHTAQVWETTNVIPLAGWINVYGDSDSDEFTTDCPALLAQEHRYSITPDDGNGITDQPEPFPTRIVPADFHGDQLWPAAEAANYRYTTSRDEYEGRRQRHSNQPARPTWGHGSPGSQSPPLAKATPPSCGFSTRPPVQGVPAESPEQPLSERPDAGEGLPA